MSQVSRISDNLHKLKLRLFASKSSPVKPDDLIDILNLLEQLAQFVDLECQNRRVSTRHVIYGRGE